MNNVTPQIISAIISGIVIGLTVAKIIVARFISMIDRHDEMIVEHAIEIEVLKRRADAVEGDLDAAHNKIREISPR